MQLVLKCKNSHAAAIFWQFALSRPILMIIITSSCIYYRKEHTVLYLILVTLCYKQHTEIQNSKLYEKTLQIISSIQAYFFREQKMRIDAG